MKLKSKERRSVYLFIWSCSRLSTPVLHILKLLTWMHQSEAVDWVVLALCSLIFKQHRTYRTTCKEEDVNRGVKLYSFHNRHFLSKGTHKHEVPACSAVVIYFSKNTHNSAVATLLDYFRLSVWEADHQMRNDLPKILCKHGDTFWWI